MSDVTIERLRIPETLEGPGGSDFVEMTAVRNRIEAETMGNTDLNFEAAELLPFWQDPYRKEELWVARVDGRIVARVFFESPEEGREAWFGIEVLPEFRRRGIGSALFETVTGLARRDGRDVLQTYAMEPAGFDDPLPAPTGFGAVSRRSAPTRFLTGLGFELQQVERMSRLELPLDHRIRELSSRADYRVVTWVGRTPEVWLDDIALLLRRMSTDAPSADLEVSEEQWDAARVRDLDDRQERSPRTRLTAAAVHEPSGRLAAFTVLDLPAELHRPVSQEDTLVLIEHRGHRLGMLLKLANLRQLQQVRPGHPSVITFNAEENRPMLDVNEAIGFAAVAYSGGWRRSLTPPVE